MRKFLIEVKRISLFDRKNWSLVYKLFADKHLSFKCLFKDRKNWSRV